MRYFRHLKGPLFKRSFVGWFSPGKTEQTMVDLPDKSVSVPDLRAVMEKVYQAETHLKTFSVEDRDGIDGRIQMKKPRS